MKPENFPDKTLSELEEESNDELDNIQEDITDEIADRKESLVLIASTIALSEMFEDDVLTLREYIRLTEYLGERNNDLEHAIL